MSCTEDYSVTKPILAVETLTSSVPCDTAYPCMPGVTA